MGATYTGLSYSKDQTADFSRVHRLRGSDDLRIGLLHVRFRLRDRQCDVSGSPVFSFASLRGRDLTVRGGTALDWGPTYVAGSVAITKSGPCPAGLLVTAGNFSVSGSEILAGTGSACMPNRFQVLLVGQNKQATITDTSISTACSTTARAA